MTTAIDMSFLHGEDSKALNSLDSKSGKTIATFYET